ncbi:hypothetical protein HYV43_07245 [Candidatus Micrarchaeota archaeon]|nr:hypothetical protein [Candidatus Micrarchaeota archaeon]
MSGLPYPTYKVFTGSFELSDARIPPGARITSVYMAPRDQADRDGGGCPNLYLNGQLVNNPSCTVCTPPSGGSYCGVYGFQIFAGPINYASPGIQMPLTFSGSVSSDGSSASLHVYATISYRAPACG